MRSIPLLAAITVISFGAWSCGGDDDGGVGPNEQPTANFTGGPCTVGVPCTFTDASSDPQGATTITTRSWDFNGDGVEDLGGNVTTPTYTYQTEGTFQAKLTVTDNTGNTDDAVVSISVTGGTTGGNPTASMDAPVCTGLTCNFHSTSTDVAPGTIVSTDWDFGEAGSPTNTATGIDASHTYAAAGTYTVTLTVTDNEGLTASTTQAVTVTAPTAQDCVAAGTDVIDCALDMSAAASRVDVTLTGVECQLVGNRVFVPPPQPAAQDIFLNVCFFHTPGEVVTLVDDAGGNLTFAAGSQLHIRFRRGTGTPAPNAPAAQIVGSYPHWKINIDDGGDTSQPRDFNDVVLDVNATQ